MIRLSDVMRVAWLATLAEAQHFAVQNFQGAWRKFTRLTVRPSRDRLRVSEKWPLKVLSLDNGKHLYTIAHEVRSMTHPLYARPLVNRNPVQTNRNYRPGYDVGQWAAPHGS